MSNPAHSMSLMQQLAINTAIGLRDVLDEVAEAYGAIAEDTAQSLVYDRPQTTIFIRGDAEVLAQLVVNLVQNVITHADAGTRITVCTRQSASGVELNFSDARPGLRITATFPRLTKK